MSSGSYYVEGPAVSSIQQITIAQISDSIYGVAGYYSENDSTQHVVVATTDGTLYEIHWNQYIPVTSPQPLRRSPGLAPVRFNGIHSLCGYFTSDDNYQHVIVATRDGRLHELYFMDSQNVRVRNPLYQLPTTAGPHIGMAGFFAPPGKLSACCHGWRCGQYLAQGCLERIYYSFRAEPCHPV